MTNNPMHDNQPEQRPRSTRDPIGDPTRCGHHGGRRKDGSPCVGPVVAGTTRCRMHGGKRGTQLKAEGKIREEIRKWTLDGHDGTTVDAAATLLQLIAFWRWKMSFYGRLVGEAYEAAEALRQAHDAGVLLTTPDGTDRSPHAGGGFGDDDGEPVTEDPALQVARADLERVFTTGGVTALVGNRYDADRYGRVYAVDEGIRALVRLEGEASDRVAKYAALAIQAKVAEARIDLAKQVGSMISAVIVGVLGDLGVAPDERVFALVARHMDAVGPNVIEGEVSK